MINIILCFFIKIKLKSMEITIIIIFKNIFPKSKLQ